MDYLVVLGKNETLSLAEIVSYLQARRVPFLVKAHTHGIAVLELAQQQPQALIADWGGTIKISEVCSILDQTDLSGRHHPFTLATLFPDIRGNQVRFGVSVYADSAERIWEAVAAQIKDAARSSRTRMIHVAPPKGASALPHYAVLAKLLRKGGTEFLVAACGDRLFLGRTLAVHDPAEFRKRDTGRPHQRPLYSIPPRLAKALINLSGATPGRVLLDPFCGIGTILQEAVLMGIAVKGIDSDPQCIRMARENLAWLKKECPLPHSAEITLIPGDARTLSHYLGRDSVDAVATEPVLGPPLRRMPTAPEARKIIQTITPLYTQALKEIHKVLTPGGRVSMVSPRFRTRDGSIVALDMPALARQAGFIVRRPFEGCLSLPDLQAMQSIVDADPTQRTQREIWILENRK